MAAVNASPECGGASEDKEYQLAARALCDGGTCGPLVGLIAGVVLNCVNSSCLCCLVAGQYSDAEFRPDFRRAVPSGLHTSARGKK